jgi:two-component system, LytTR family, response regulator
MSRASVLVVDDEKPARQRLVELLERSPEIASIRECSNGLQAIEVIRQDPPDLLFLDIQMPELDGFGVLDHLGPAHAPVIVFVTAYDRFALEAFARSALDYLLKPFSDERFDVCLKRALEQWRMREHSNLALQFERLLATWNTKAPEAAGFLHRLVLKNAGRAVFLDVDEIAWIEAAGVYVHLHTRERSYLYRMLLGELELRLDPARFVRVHRSTIVNLRSIQELRLQTHGDCVIVLKDGTELKLSRNYRAKLGSCLGQTI